MFGLFKDKKTILTDSHEIPIVKCNVPVPEVKSCRVDQGNKEVIMKITDLEHVNCVVEEYELAKKIYDNLDKTECIQITFKSGSTLKMTEDKRVKEVSNVIKSNYMNEMKKLEEELSFFGVEV